MSETGNVGVSRVVRLTVGLVSLTAGVFWLLISLSGVHPRDIVTGVALAGGGLVLLLWRRVPLSGRVASAAAGVAGIGGTAAGLAVHSATVCCMFGYREGRGWPYAWLGRGADADSPGEARRLAGAQSWELQGPMAVAADVAVCAYTGLVLIVVFALVRRAVRRTAS